MKDLSEKFKNEMYAKTKKYQKIYGFDIGTGEHDTWNNEADEKVKTGDLIWVNSYNRDDGTKVCGYYRRK